MKLNQLSDRDGATRARKRVGRGPGSGLGKTAGTWAEPCREADPAVIGTARPGRESPWERARTH